MGLNRNKVFNILVAIIIVGFIVFNLIIIKNPKRENPISSIYTELDDFIYNDVTHDEYLFGNIETEFKDADLYFKLDCETRQTYTYWMRTIVLIEDISSYPSTELVYYEKGYNNSIQNFSKEINDKIRAFNSEIEILYDKWTKQNYNVHLADFENSLNYSNDMYNYLHPNRVGQGKMAEIFFQKIQGITQNNLFNNPVKILPLGDSITFGLVLDSNSSYRVDLEKKLLDANILYDFVGSQQNGNMVDKDHEGYSGVTAGWINERLNGPENYILNNTNPDIILYFIGLNDIVYGDDFEKTINDLEKFLEITFSFNPQVHVVLSKITLSVDKMKYVSTGQSIVLEDYSNILDPNHLYRITLLRKFGNVDVAYILTRLNFEI